MKLVTAPASDPITTAEAKTHDRIDTTANDSYIATLIKAATRMAERYTGAAFITQTWEMWLDAYEVGGASSAMRQKAAMGWPLLANAPGVDPTIVLPHPPLQSVDYVKYYGTDDTESTFAASNYGVDTGSETQPGRIWLNVGSTWPSGLRSANAMVIRYTVGYGDNPTDVPEDIRHAIMMIVADLYEYRASVTTDAVREVPYAAKALLDPYKVMEWVV